MLNKNQIGGTIPSTLSQLSALTELCVVNPARSRIWFLMWSAISQEFKRQSIDWVDSQAKFEHYGVVRQRHARL